ncbi:MAG: exodeoxyribonuclease VII large subunit [Candidatus Thermochlorobacter sp.]
MFDGQIFSVSKLSERIKEVLEQSISSVRLRGEVSNFKKQTSGHLYFTLKDASAQINAVMWRSYAEKLRFEMKDGLELVVEGEVQVYMPQGRYQVSCFSAQPVGEGYLQQEFLRLFEKLRTAGLFDEARKKPLPRLPERIGIITSPTGAVIEDMRRILGRRYPAAELILYPARVQGEEATKELIAGVRYFNTMKPRPDVLILARGGGSIEDLWCFNDEALAHEIFRSEIPIVSAVGHETNFTIADHVADVRASTPSMAAEIVAPPAQQILEQIDRLLHVACTTLRSRVDRYATNLDNLVNSYAFNRPQRDLDTLLQRLDYAQERLERSIMQRMHHTSSALDSAIKRLSALGHEQILHRGYVVAYKHGRPIRSATEAQLDDELTLHFHDGIKHVRVLNK